MFRRRSGVFVALSVSLLTLSACSADAEAENPSAAAPTVDTVQESASPSPTPTPPARNDRGDIIKEIGDPAGAGYIDAEPHTIEFTVESISEVTCTDPLWTPEDLTAEDNSLIAVEISATTQPAKGEHQKPWEELYGEISFGHEWVIFDSAGKRMNSADSMATFMCLSDSELVPSQIGPGETVQGKVVLEVSDRAGEITFRPWWLDGGWSWSYDLDGPEGVDA